MNNLYCFYMEYYNRRRFLRDPNSVLLFSGRAALKLVERGVVSAASESQLCQSEQIK